MRAWFYDGLAFQDLPSILFCTCAQCKIVGVGSMYIVIRFPCAQCYYVVCHVYVLACPAVKRGEQDGPEIKCLIFSLT